MMGIRLTIFGAPFRPLIHGQIVIAELVIDNLAKEQTLLIKVRDQNAYQISIVMTIESRWRAIHQ